MGFLNTLLNQKFTERFSKQELDIDSLAQTLDEDSENALADNKQTFVRRTTGYTRREHNKQYNQAPSFIDRLP